MAGISSSSGTSVSTCMLRYRSAADLWSREFVTIVCVRRFSELGSKKRETVTADKNRLNITLSSSNHKLGRYIPSVSGPTRRPSDGTRRFRVGGPSRGHAPNSDTAVSELFPSIYTSGFRVATFLSLLRNFERSCLAARGASLDA